VSRDVGAEPLQGQGAIRAGKSRVSVVVPTLNGGARFFALLERLARQEIDGGFELIVIDSSSDDGTPEVAARAGAKVVRIARGEFNHGRTRNRAIELATGERIVLLVQDALPVDGGFVSMLSGALEDPSLDGAYARQVARPGADPILAERLRLWSASRTIASISRLSEGDAAAARAAFERLSPAERYRACAFDNVASCVRKSTWRRIPFPERSFGEDVAWAREVLLTGGAIAFTPRAAVEHSHAISIRREFARLYRDHQNLSELFELRTVGSWSEVRAGSRAQRRYYCELLDKSGLSWPARAHWKTYAGPYALAETLAQFLGARSPWKTREKGWRGSLWRWLDQHLRA
jgi:rhamnosyltransferase